ncbi:MAG TPA: carboxypeptidase-like regulatory domain-containing protein [Vicinamibacterales bacterium]|nr:carboxypeptidase-like regulatory domain-containing protein [Vicinamibacterales bacterium]
MVGRTSASVALLLTVLIAAPAAAQLTTGTFTGTIKDGTGLVVPGATVVLTSEARGTQLPTAVTNAQGDFVIVNVPPDTYTLEVTMQGFKPLKRSGLSMSAGDRVGLGVLVVEVGALTETVTVQAESPLVQTQSGERSFTVTTQAVQNLPISNRSFVQLASLAPGVTGNNPSRVGDRSSTGGNNSNIMMDGISTMDTGSNSVLLQMNVESIAEVKVLVSSYQAEYGRSSGVQVSAVTKSGTNRFRGSAYDVMRQDRWNSNSRTNILNGDPKARVNEKDLGYTIGGPIGKPGGNNKLFFFYAHEYAPRTSGGDTVRFRFPTALERAGDFSQSLDNNGNLYPYVRDPLSGAPCNANNTAGCFQSGGVIGRIPADRLYQTGLNILKMYPMPNVTAAQYNFELVRPAEKLRANQPALRLDYQPTMKLRGTFKYAGWSQQDVIIPGTIPGWNDTRQYNPFVRTIATTVNYSVTNATFLEGTWGRAQNSLTGCALAQANTGPSFCRAAFPMNDNASLAGAGLQNLPFIFPEASVINQSYFAYEALNGVNPPIWDGTRISMVPNFAWGSRIANAPSNIPFPGYLNVNKTNDISISLTNVRGRHTLKAGFYNTHSYKAQQRQGWQGTINFQNDANNPLDTTFGYANAAVGVFSSFQQFSKYVEGSYVYDNTEGYVQDNWKVNNKWTLDYGIRLVRQQPQYDELGQAANFLPDQWSPGSAPYLYTAGCAATPCTGNNRQARDPRTGLLLGPATSVAIGTLVPNSGNTTNGLFLSGQGISKTTYIWPKLRVAPRFGTAYDVTGRQNLVLRGGGGLFFDRPAGNSIYQQVQNPPTIRNVTLRYSTLQSLTSGLATEAPPTLTVYQYESGLPSTWQWNGGVQMVLPWAVALDVEYTGQHAYNLVENVNINAIDFGTAYLAANQDPTVSSALPGGAAVTADQMRAFRGFGSITQAQPRGWLTSHSLQMSFNRRFRNGVSFGFNDAWLISQKGSAGARLQHNADGTFSERADQADADRLLGRFVPVKHTFKGNFVWDLPDLHGSGAAMKGLGLALNDWQLSGVWTGATGSAYTVGTSYQTGGSQNVTGSPDYGGRMRIVGDIGSGCSSDPLRQFVAAGFAPPLVNSVGLESGADYLRGCFQSTLDMSIARNIRFPGQKQLQIRLDVFNAPNSAITTGRNTTLSVASPLDPTPANLPYDASGNVVVSRSQPKNAGFGVANAYQAPRTMQLQIRFSF